MRNGSRSGLVNDAKLNPDLNHLLVCNLISSVRDCLSISKLLGFSKSCLFYTVMSPEPWHHRILGQSSRSHHCTHHVLVLWLVLDDEVFVCVVEISEFARKKQQGEATDTTRRRARHRATSSSWSTHGRSGGDHANERRNIVVNVTQQELSYQKSLEQHKYVTSTSQMTLKQTSHIQYLMLFVFVHENNI